MLQEYRPETGSSALPRGNLPPWLCHSCMQDMRMRQRRIHRWLSPQQLPLGGCVYRAQARLHQAANKDVEGGFRPHPIRVIQRLILFAHPAQCLVPIGASA